MNMFKLKQKNISDFIVHLQNSGDVIAPHAKGENSFSFSKVTDPDAVVLDYNRTLQSVRKYFLPPTEQLLSYSTVSNQFDKTKIKARHQVFLGVHSYDMHAVLKLDYNFTQGSPEMNYLSRRKNSYFIGVSFTPDEYHFSRSVGIPVEDFEGFDLFLRKNDTDYILIVLTDKGEELINGFDMDKKNNPVTNPSPEFPTQIKINYNQLPIMFEKSWDSPVWDALSDKCVGCGTCNLVCPTCYCFNVEDTLDLSLKKGTRDRHWDGCTLNSFAAVAGGENFREKLGERQRHRLYRKFKYISDITGEPWCVGCGRCIASCTAGISIVETVNQLKSEYEQNHLMKPASQSGWVG